MDWNRFLKEWGEPYDRGRHILHYLRSYPEVLTRLELNDIMDPNDLDKSQKDWIRLCSKFDHPLEQEFFKPYWVPVKKDSYDYFMDLSHKAFPIFETHFFWLKPYRWIVRPIAEDISTILLACDSAMDLDVLNERSEAELWNSISRMFDERLKLVFEGKLEVKALERHEVWPDEDDEDGRVIPPITTDTTVTLPGVRPSAVGLFPYELPVSLVHLDKNNGDICRHAAHVRTIRDLVFLIRHEGPLRVASYRLEFPDQPEGSIVFEEDQLIIMHPDQGILDRLIEKLEKLK